MNIISLSFLVASNFFLLLCIVLFLVRICHFWTVGPPTELLFSPITIHLSSLKKYFIYCPYFQLHQLNIFNILLLCFHRIFFFALICREFLSIFRV